MEAYIPIDPKPSDLIQKLLNESIKIAGSITKLSKALGIRVGTVRLWYRAGAQPNIKNMKSLEKYVEVHRNY